MIAHSEGIAKLAAALVKVACQIENPHKNSTNPAFRSRYADLAEIINTARTLLAEHGVVVVQSPGMDGACATVETMLLHESGEWIRGVAACPLQKADPQGVGSAITYLRRYSLAAMLGLAQEDDDGNAGSARPTARAAQPAPAPKPTATPEAVRKRIESAALAGAITEAEAAGALEAIADAGRMASVDEWLTAKAEAFRAARKQQDTMRTLVNQ